MIHQYVSLIAICILLTGCRSTVTVPVERISADTVRLTNIQYDSIYVCQDRSVDRLHDTVYVRNKSIEYRYRLLRDTIRIIHHDSIPYQVTVTEVARQHTWFDKLSRTCSLLLIGILLAYVVRRQ